MKALGVISTTALLLLFGATIPAFAQEEHHEQDGAKPAEHQQEAKPAQHQEQAKPAQKKEEAKPAKQEEQAKPAQHEEQAKPAKQQEQAKAKPERQEQQAKPVKQEERGQAAGHAQRSAAEEQRQRSVPALRLSARGSGRIPDDRFRANFGEGHTFIINEPVMVGGFSRFPYGGFWFGFVNPWPVEWYYTDHVYVDYIDGGYYLLNPEYPGARVSISVVI